MSKEYYRVVHPSCDTILHSSTPSSAAAKAFSKCFSKRSKSSRKSRIISVQRRSGNQKIMKYRVKALKTPNRTVERGDKMIKYSYKTKVKSLNKKR